MDNIVTWSESNSQNTQSMFREETLLYSAQGAGCKISTSRAHLLRFSVHTYTLQLKHHAYLIRMFHLTIAYSLCWASMMCCSLEQSSQSLLHLHQGLWWSSVVVWGRIPLLLLSFYGHASSEDTRVFVSLANPSFLNAQGGCMSLISKSVTLKCPLSGALTIIQTLLKHPLL